MKEPNYLKWLAIAVCLISITFLKHDINQVKRSQMPVEAPPAPVVIREKYFRGDIVKLANGTEAWISDKSLRVGNGKEWNYEVNASGIKKQWVSELSIESVVRESPTRPKAEK